MELQVPDDAPALLYARHDGGSNFALSSLDESKENIDLLVNTIGRYEGVRPINFLEGEEVRWLDVEADGAWRIEARPLSRGTRMKANGRHRGTGDEVLLLHEELSEATITRFEHSGESNFAVVAWGESRDLVVNEIGRHDSREIVPRGTVLLEIEADGEWTINLIG